MKSKLKAEIKHRKNIAKINHDSTNYQLYNFLLNKSYNLHFIRQVGNSLLAQNSHEYKHYAADILSELGDERVIPYLLKAAKAEINKGFSAPYLWACSKYSCNKYLINFINIIIQSDEANEDIVACLAVFMSLSPPYNVSVLKKSLVRLLNKKVDDSFMELLIAQCCHTITDKYFTQANDSSKED